MGRCTKHHNLAQKIIKNYIYNDIVQNHIYIESVMYIKLNISCTFIYTLVCTFIKISQTHHVFFLDVPDSIQGNKVGRFSEEKFALFLMHHSLKNIKQIFY